MKESAIQRAILDYLAARHILAFRLNSGALRNPAGRPVNFGVPGMADILAFPSVREKNTFSFGGTPYETSISTQIPTWLECKTPNGKQSELQKSFQAQVESYGHRYAIVRSVEDVEAILR